MNTVSSPFDRFRVDAAREFAQTMIVIDDEARQSLGPSSIRTVGKLRQPTRQSSSAGSSVRVSAQSKELPASVQHSLDAKALVEKSMELGLICSVLRPREGEEFQDKVVNAASIADIVCLDWEIYQDEGDAASRIIHDIIDEDNEKNGRLRLIAIYTGDSTNNKILEKVLNAIPQEIRRNQGFRKRQLHIESATGVRIVCLFKAHGIQLKDSRSKNQISEEFLPERLLEEFSRLSDGLLSGVALATAGSMRRSTHHVLSQFPREMDGPYFHHRAMLENPEDAEGYAVDVVLSQLESFVNRERLAKKYAGCHAIEARIEESSKNLEKLTLHYRSGEKSPRSCELEKNASIRMVQDGIESAWDPKNLPNGLGKKVVKRYFSTLFFRSLEDSRAHMHRFAAITGLRAHPDHYLFKLRKRVPKLGLGTIIRSKEQEYLLCLQAACDSVRVDDETSFLFVPLDEADDQPEHVVPVSEKGESQQFIGLQTSSNAYRTARSIYFCGSGDTRTVNAERSENCSEFYFKDLKGELYRWVADLKHRRALRTVQNLAQDMGRLGFDEFEPYRR